KLILDFNINISDDDKYYILNSCIKNKSTEVMELLLNNFNYSQKDKDEALIHVIFINDKGTNINKYIKVLVQYGANINANYLNKKPPLITASLNNNLKSV